MATSRQTSQLNAACSRLVSVLNNTNKDRDSYFSKRIDDTKYSNNENNLNLKLEREAFYCNN